MIAMLLIGCYDFGLAAGTVTCEKLDVEDHCWAVRVCTDGLDEWAESRKRKHYCAETCDTAVAKSMSEACGGDA